MAHLAGTRLGLGQFLGTGTEARPFDGLLCRELVPTVAEREVEVHTHVEAHLVLVLEGRYLSTAAGAPDVAPAPALVYNPPGTTHRDRFADLAGRFFTVSLEADQLRRWTDVAPLPPRPSWIVTPAARAAMAGLRLEARRDDADAALAAQHWAWALAAALAGTPDAGLSDVAGWLLRTRDRLHDECTEVLRLDVLASDAGVHPGHLTRAFRTAFGCTPGEYQRLCRFERALGLLERTDMPLAEVAADCGYADQSHLTRALTRHLRHSPRRLRLGLSARA